MRWLVVGAFECTGRDQYIANMTIDQVEGHPGIAVIAYIEGVDDVVVEGTVTQHWLVARRSRSRSRTSSPSVATTSTKSAATACRRNS